MRKPRWVLTRLETWAMPGVPDLLVCDEVGDFHLIELKFTTSKVVALSPHQVSFMAKHKKSSVWILVWKADRKGGGKQDIYLYHGKDAIDVRMEGLNIKPLYHADGAKDWGDVLDLISVK